VENDHQADAAHHGPMRLSWTREIRLAQSILRQQGPNMQIATIAASLIALSVSSWAIFLTAQPKVDCTRIATWNGHELRCR
jgi:hypothetical protein